MRGWLADHDPGLGVLKRSVRAAVVMPATFALAHVAFADTQVGLFAAFGSFALLLLVEFPGRPRDRTLSYLALVAVGFLLVAVGTLVSTHPVAAVVAMAVLGFAVLFAGIAAPPVAAASTAALLMFVLPVAVAGPASAVGPRFVGFGLAAVTSVTACVLWWPPPWHDDLRTRLADAARAVAALCDACHAPRGDPAAGPGPAGPEPVGAARARVVRALEGLHHQFEATPYPPTSLVPAAVALAKLVGRLEWAASNATALVGTARPDHLLRASRLLDAVAATLRAAAGIVCDGQGHPVPDPAAAEALRRAQDRLEAELSRAVTLRVALLTDVDAQGEVGPPPAASVDVGSASPDPVEGGSAGIASAFDPLFQARALALAVEMVADGALEAAGAVNDDDRRFGPGGQAPGHQMWTRIASHLSGHSVWLRNSVRGAAGLALAVAVVELTNVEHGFWVVLGTLSVLRSSAVGTESTALRAIGGTAIGFVIGAAVMVALGGHTGLLWVVLPLAVLLSGFAPTTVSFAAGQAAFTVTVVVLFNIIEPEGWRVGLTRIEDVTIGCLVSVVVGLLFWPRGATAALGRALAEAFSTNSGYLADAIDRLTDPTRQLDVDPSQQASHRAYLRLDDAFRQFLSERGAKVVPVDTVATLATGANRIRLAAYALSALPVEERVGPDLDRVAVAGAVLRDASASSHRWYEEFAQLLEGERAALDPPPTHDATLEVVLRDAFVAAREARRSDQIRRMLPMLWADQLLETQRKVQEDLAGSAGRFVRRGRRALT